MRTIITAIGALCCSYAVPHATPAIAVWAYPDGVSLPYRDDANLMVADSNAHIGIAAYHPTGIARIAFIVQGETTAVSDETVNPETGEYEYVLVLDPAAYAADGEYIIDAVAFPDSGEARMLPHLTVFKDTETHDVLTVGTGGQYATLDAACDAASGGDVISVQSGSYDLPDDSGYDFTRYVTIRPADGAVVTIGSGSLRSSYIKFSGVTFDLTTSVSAGIISSEYTHFWFDGCTAVGYGKDVAENNATAFRFYTNADNIVITNCTMHEMGHSASLTAGNTIFRNNHVYDVTSDGMSYNGPNVLVSGNLIHDNLMPDSGSQHCDFISSSLGAQQVVIRNNRCYNGDHQGLKMGSGIAVDQPYNDIAVVNNMLALNRGSVSVNLRFQNRTQTYSNIMVEHNTFWNGNPFVVDADSVLEDVLVRNNIFGYKPVADMSALSGISVNHNCYHAGTATGAGSVTGYPAFTDTTAWNFFLTAASPVIGGADGAAGIFYDLDWRARDAAADMGAYEYAAGSALRIPVTAPAAGVLCLPNPLGGGWHGLEIRTLDGCPATGSTDGAVLVKVPGEDRYVKRILLK